ncbi:hypothetical protein SaSA20_0109a [Streptococcus agalactiae]|nr:hypothetical protein SaSA20_0109a [Streptococcus agalactiae]
MLADTKSVFVGIHPMLIHVPPYILSSSSTIATLLPCVANFAANVLPALPKPRTMTSYFFILNFLRFYSIVSV